MEAFCTLSNPGPEIQLSCYVTTLPHNVVRRIQIRIETYWPQGGFCSLDDAGRLVRRYRFMNILLAETIIQDKFIQFLVKFFIVLVFQ